MSHTVTPGEQFVFIVLEFQQYYNENCMYLQFVGVAAKRVHCSGHKQ